MPTRELVCDAVGACKGDKKMPEGAGAGVRTSYDAGAGAAKPSGRSATSAARLHEASTLCRDLGYSSEIRDSCK